MVLGALLDAGLPFDELKAALGSLAMSGYEVTAERVLRAGVSATKFRRASSTLQAQPPSTLQAQPTAPRTRHHHHVIRIAT